MRLLQYSDQDGLSITENLVKNIPPYAILSHTWLADQDEVTFKDVKKGLGQDKKGYTKIVSCGEQARRDGILHFWVDTCCIDKRSSAELSEAINSMFRWYRKSVICYAYLFDVDHRHELPTSSWFQRGWTLQELLAPSTVRFFSRDWTFLSERNSMLKELEESTLIPQEALSNFESQKFAIAEKMSWSAGRITTREEDLAYCLLGLFDINMPLIYGEGSKAFTRLQQAIMDQSTDLSLFLWTGRACDNFGMLAADPSCFHIKHPLLYSSHYQRIFEHPEGWTRNNAGISLKLSLRPFYLDEYEQAVFIAVIHKPFSGVTTGYGIFLVTTDHSSTETQYKRIVVDGETFVKLTQLSLPDLSPYQALVTDVQILNEPMAHSTSAGNHSFTIKWQGPPSAQVRVYQRPTSNVTAACRYWPMAATRETTTPEICFQYKRREMQGIFAFLTITCCNEYPLLIWLGLDVRLQPICMVMVCFLDYMDLQAWNVIHAFDSLHRFNHDQDEISDLPTVAYALRASEGLAEFSLYNDNLRLSLDFSVLELEFSMNLSETRIWLEHEQLQIRNKQLELFLLRYH